MTCLIGSIAFWTFYGFGEPIGPPPAVGPPPADYRVLCSIDGKKYCLWIPGEKGSKGYLGPNVWNSEKAAIEFAYH